MDKGTDVFNALAPPGQPASELDDKNSSQGSSGGTEEEAASPDAPLAERSVPVGWFIDLFTRRRQAFDLNAVATQPSVYNDPQ